MSRKKSEPALHYIAEPLRALAIPIDTVHPDPSNARVHTASNLTAIRVSIETKGQDQPIVVRAQDMVVSKGHGRLAAMRVLGYDYIAAVVIDETRISAIERGLVDNRSSDLAETDVDMLADLFRLLEEEGGVVMGWSENEVTQMLLDVEAAQAQVELEAAADEMKSGGSPLSSTPTVDAPVAPNPTGADIKTFSAALTSAQNAEVVAALRTHQASQGLLTLGDALYSAVCNKG